MLIITRIPTHLNDGTPVDPQTLRSILRDVARRFGGYTLEGPAEGAWVDDAGRAYEETSWRLEVETHRNRLTEGRETVVEIGRTLGQLAMYFELRYADGVEIIPVK